MATAGRRPYADLIEALRLAPGRFELLQAIRLIEQAAAAENPGAASAPLGFDSDPRREAVILRSALELGFPSSDIVKLERTDGRPELTVAVMGLAGVCGALPVQYTQLVLEAHRAKNSAPRDFLDLFNHRALSLFLRAAAKYRQPLSYERGARSDSDDQDAISAALKALVGIGLPSLQRRQEVPDETLLFYSGHLARQARPASGLASMLSEYFGKTVRIAQFQGRWASWSVAERTRLGKANATAGEYAFLGRTAVLGAQVWDVQSAFRVSLGPLNYTEFLQFLPGGEQFTELKALTRIYVGPTFSFDVQLTLRGVEVPALRLAGRTEPGSRLGRNSWLPIQQARGDAAEAIFDGGD
jgi:type VI secretion system protein ImpH